MADSQIGLTIKTVADRTGVSVHTLRAWERRYGVPSPNRNADNHYRLYDEQDIADVLFLKRHIDSGVSPSQASLLLRRQPSRPADSVRIESQQPIIAMQQSLLDAFARSDETAARQILDEAFALFAPEPVALEIVEPTLRAIGDKWVRNEMTVWQEHLASNLVQQKLFSVLQSQPAASMMAPHLVAACAPSEEHQVGLVILALLARRQGWRVSFLGRNTPLGDILQHSRQTPPNAIVISVTTTVGLAGLIPWLDAANRPAAPLVFGGRMPNLLPSLREHLPGTFLGENTMAAVRNLASVKARDDWWTPSKRALNLANALQAHRLKIAGDVAEEFMAGISKSPRGWNAADVNFATLFLIDALACALAFDVPALMELEQAWLNEAMPVRAVSSLIIAKHLAISEMVLRKTFSADQARLLAPLIARMKNFD